jgi:hypothetical protein
MSIRTIAAIAVKRDAGVSPGPPAPEAVPAAGEGPALPDTSDLAAALPTEVVALYTAAIALLEGILHQNVGATYAPLRWWLYGAGFVFTVVTVQLAYGSISRGARGSKKRKAPVKELIVGLLAFAVWGLVLPGSALYEVLGNPALTVSVGLVTLGGTTMVGLLQKYFLTTPSPRLPRHGAAPKAPTVLPAPTATPPPAATAPRVAKPPPVTPPAGTAGNP